MRILRLLCSYFVAQSVIAATISDYDSSTKIPSARRDLNGQTISTNRLLRRADKPQQQQNRKNSSGPANLSQPPSEKSINSRPAAAPVGQGQRGRNSGTRDAFIRPGSQQSSGQLQQQNRYGPRPRTTTGQTANQAPLTAPPGFPNPRQHPRLFSLLNTAAGMQARRSPVAQATNPVAQNTEPIFNPFSQQTHGWQSPSSSVGVNGGRSPRIQASPPALHRAPVNQIARPRLIDDLLRTPPAQAAATVGPLGRIRVNNHFALHPDYAQTTDIQARPGRRGARQDVAGQYAAHAGASNFEQNGFATSKARGTMGVSTYMSTGPNSRGCINCYLPGQHPVKIDVGPDTPLIHVQSQNAHSWLGPAEITAEVSGQGSTFSNGYNHRLKRRAEIG